MAGKFGTFGVGIDLPAPVLGQLLEDPKASLFEHIAKVVDQASKRGLFGPTDEERLIRARLKADKELEAYKKSLEPVFEVQEGDSGKRTVAQLGPAGGGPLTPAQEVQQALAQRGGGPDPAIGGAMYEGARMRRAPMSREMTPVENLLASESLSPWLGPEGPAGGTLERVSAAPPVDPAAVPGLQDDPRFGRFPPEPRMDPSELFAGEAPLSENPVFGRFPPMERREFVDAPAGRAALRPDDLGPNGLPAVDFNGELGWERPGATQAAAGAPPAPPGTPAAPLSRTIQGPPDQVAAAWDGYVAELEAEGQRLESEQFRVGKTSDRVQANEWRKHNDALKQARAKNRMDQAEARIKRAEAIEKAAAASGKPEQAAAARAARGQVLLAETRGTKQEKLVADLERTGALYDLDDQFARTILDAANDERKKQAEVALRGDNAEVEFALKVGRAPSSVESKLLRRAAEAGDTKGILEALVSGEGTIADKKRYDRLIKNWKITKEEAEEYRLETAEDVEDYLEQKKAVAEDEAKVRRLYKELEEVYEPGRQATLGQVSSRKRTIDDISKEIDELEKRYLPKDSAAESLPTPQVAQDRIDGLKRLLRREQASFDAWVATLVERDAERAKRGEPLLFPDPEAVPRPYSESKKPGLTGITRLP